MSDAGKQAGEMLENISLHSGDGSGEALEGMPARKIGEILDSLLFLAFGGISHRARQRKLAYARDLLLFEEEVKRKVEAIPAHKRKEPNTRIILNALHDAESCVQEKNLRAMFSNLIASAATVGKSAGVHPSFSTIIRTMSCEDAEFLMKLQTTGDLPIADVSLVRNAREMVLFRRLCITDPINDDPITKTSVYVDSLLMHGLIKVDYDYHLPIAFHDLLEKTQTMKALRVQMELDDDKRMPRLRGYGDVVVTGAVVQLTQLGLDFLASCT